MSERIARGIRSAQAGLLTNAGLAITKLVAGVLGHSYALVADAIESTADIFSSMIVWGGLRISGRSADENYPFGYGKAEPLAAAIVSLMLLGAAILIAVQSVQEILTPHHAPAKFTLVVLVGVIAIKEFLFRKVFTVGMEVGSTAVRADAWHHRSDAITSAAAFVGISIALIGGRGWESADDWAALLASAIIVYNGVRILQPAIADLMDHAPDTNLSQRIAAAAESVEGVQATEKLRVRKVGINYYVDIHVQAAPQISLYEAHVLSGKVKSALRAAVPAVIGVIVHMEPFEERRSAENVRAEQAVHAVTAKKP
jgi:cation diffusion facilitator family transporter